MYGSSPLSSAPRAARARVGPSSATAGTAAQTLSAVSQAARADTCILVWNPNDTGGPATVSTDRQTLTVGIAGGGRAAIGKNDGVYQFEIVSNRQSSTSAYIGVGTLAAITAGGPGANTDGSRATGYRADGTVWTNGAQVASGGATWQTPQVVGVVVDYPANQLRFYVNGTLQSALTRTLTNFNGVPLYPMYGSGGGGVSGMTAKISGLNFAFPIAGASEWRPVYNATAAAQTLDGVSQAAALSVPPPIALTAAQTLDSVSQATAAAGRPATTAAQTLGAVSQLASLVTQNVDRTLIAAQTLGAVSQSAALALTAKAAAAQTLDGVAQSAALSARAAVQAAQVLDAVSTSAALATRTGLQAAQTLDGVVQAAVATVADTVSRLVAAQTLAGVTQQATLRRPYQFERNERTVTVIGENRQAAMLAEERSLSFVAEDRHRAVGAEDRHVAFTD